MSDSDKMRAEFEQWAEDNDCGITLAATSATGFYTRNIAWTAWQAAYQAGQKSEREEVERLLTEFRIFIEEVEQTGIYYDNARVGTALANAWRVFDDIAARIRGKTDNEDERR